MTIFWAVVRDTPAKHSTAFSARHKSEDAARAEAIRLAEKEGVPFLVLGLVGVAAPSAVTWRPAVPDPGTDEPGSPTGAPIRPEAGT